MRRTGNHQDVEYVVSPSTHFDNPDDAFAWAARIALSRGASQLDVLVYSEAGARWHGGDDAVEQYREDPDASVFERVEFRANVVGRVA